MVNLKYLFHTVWKEDKTLFLILLFDIIITTVSKYPFIVLPKYILDELVYGKRTLYVLFYVGIMVGASLIFSILSTWINEIQQKRSKRLEFQLHTNITMVTMKMPYEKLLYPDTYDKMYLASDVANGNNFMNLINSVRSFLSNIFVIISMLYIILQVDFVIMVLTLIVVVVNTMTSSRIQNKMYETRKQTGSTIRRLEYIGKLAWHIDYAKEIRAYDCKQYIVDKYSKFNEFVLNHIFRDYKVERNGKWINSLAGAVQTFGLYVMLGFKVLKNVITLGDFTMFMNAINTFQSALSGLLSNVVAIQNQSKYFAAYMEYTEEENTRITEKNQYFLPLSQDDGNRSSVFEFRNVFYRYPGQEKYALENINAVIEKDEIISLVGENGSGKTTFILLLMGFITPVSGEVLYNGVNIKNYDFNEYIKLFSAVFQDFNLFSFSIAENICFDAQKFDKDSMENLLKKCGLTNVIERTAEGVMSSIGREFDEKGIDFSGGEKQKLAIARAMFKKAPVIVLDEPTAALDIRAESEIFSKMRELAKNKTAIYISHRLYSTKFCNRILVFKDHHIVEMGSHEKLMSTNSYYKELYDLQLEFLQV